MTELPEGPLSWTSVTGLNVGGGNGPSGVQSILAAFSLYTPKRERNRYVMTMSTFPSPTKPMESYGRMLIFLWISDNLILLPWSPHLSVRNPSDLENISKKAAFLPLWDSWVMNNFRPFVKEAGGGRNLIVLGFTTLYGIDLYFPSN